MLEIGSVAPDFKLQDSDGNWVSLSDYKGKKVVLFFYLKDNTPGCSVQASLFEEMKDDIDAVILGVSKDPVEKHIKFRDKYELSYKLLADPELNMIKSYDVWKEKKSYGKVYWGVVRTTYIIDENGKIEKVFPKVSYKDNPEQVKKYLLKGYKEEEI